MVYCTYIRNFRVLASKPVYIALQRHTGRLDRTCLHKCKCVGLFYNAIGAVAQYPYKWGVGSAFHRMKIHISCITWLHQLIVIAKREKDPTCLCLKVNLLVCWPLSQGIQDRFQLFKKREKPKKKILPSFPAFTDGQRQLVSTYFLLFIKFTIAQKCVPVLGKSKS